MNDANDRKDSETEKIIPVVAEDLVVDRRPVKTGSVRVQKHVEKRVHDIDLPLLRDDVHVKRVPVNRVVKEEPPVRKSGDTIIVPVVEEEVVITKRLILKEELHVVRHRTVERAKKQVTLESERAEVQRLDEQGRVVETSARRHPAKRN